MRVLKISFVFVVGVLAGLFVLSGPALAVTTLKKVDIKDPSSVELGFDRPVSLKQVQTEFFRDIIQLSIVDVAVYPPKILPLPGKNITKLFAYQYSPKQVRFRFSVKGNAEKFEKQVSVKSKGKSLIIHWPEPVSDKIAMSSAVAIPAAGSSGTEKITDEEAKLLDRITNTPVEAQAAAPPSVSKKPGQSQQAAAKRPLASGKPLPSPWRPFGMLLLVLVLFGAGVLVCLKILKRNANSRNGVSRWLSSFSRLGSFGKNGKMLEVVASHYLGPKKSIVVVRVGKKLLVLGVSQESISLISQLNESEGARVGLEEEPDLDLSLLGISVPASEGNSKKDPAPTPDFFDLLSTEESKPGVRAQIRSKLEGLKQL